MPNSIHSLLESWRLGTLDQQGLEDLYAQLGSAELSNALDQELANNLFESDDIPGVRARLQTAVDQHIKNQTQSQSLRKGKIVRLTIRYAAAAILLLAAGTWWLLDRKETQTAVVTATTDI